MKIKIENRYTGNTLFECEAPEGMSTGLQMRHAMEKAVSDGAYLSGADLSGADLSGANLSGANLSRAYLSRADLSRADLSRADLSRAYLSRADLSRADLSGADLSGANLSGANLSRAYLSGADLSGADLSGADLSGADLSGANLTDGATLLGDSPIFQVGPIGSRRDFFTAYITDQGLRLDAGCQRQITREVFEQRLADLHGDNKHAREYRAALALIDLHAELWTKK